MSLLRNLIFAVGITALTGTALAACGGAKSPAPMEPKVIPENGAGDTCSPDGDAGDDAPIGGDTEGRDPCDPPLPQ